ncbi:MAG TPA: hypothetical protein DCX54_06810 [Flavobacteriales bacterium]|nr:hypothetical protein [Flavobacteriales bacterium]
MNALNKYVKSIALILLISTFTVVLSKFIFEQLTYKHRDLSVNVEVQSNEDVKLGICINTMPGQFGSDLHQFKLKAGETSICSIPVPKESSIKRLFLLTRPEFSSFVIKEIRVGGFYREIVWTAEELQEKLRSNTTILEGGSDYSVDENGLHIVLTRTAPVVSIHQSWAESFYDALGRDSLIFACSIGVLMLLSLILFRQKLLGWSDNPGTYSIVFSSVFLVFIFIPFFSAKEIESSENRILAPFPDFNQLIWKIPAQYTKYYEDHFPFRNQLANLNNLLRIKVFNTSPLPNHLSLGKEGWLYYNIEEVRHAYVGATLFTDEELRRIKRILEEKAAYVEGRNADFYFIMPPLKHSVYPEFLPSNLRKLGPLNKRDQVMAYLKENSKVKLIDPLEMYLAKKDSVRLFYKTDSHWNQLGAFYTYQLIMKRIARDHPGLEPLSIDDYTISRSKSYTGDLLDLIDLHNLFYREPYHLTPKNPSEQHLIITYNNIGDEVDYVAYENTVDTLPRLLMFRDSYADYLKYHFSNHFSYSGFSWTHTLQPERVKLVKPDIVVFEQMERFVDDLLIENPEEVRAELRKNQP